VCGIVGAWGKVEQSQLKAMMEMLVHRGPDADGLYVSADKSQGLGHRRLSIMDPEGGDQPIFNEDGLLAVIANGEIYNYPQLIPNLTERHILSTRSDSEALLHLYEDHGAELVDQLDGMYAFAIAEGDGVFLARDPIGIKPVYLGRRGDSVLFSSELKALAPFCEEVREFPPGTFFHSRKGFHTFYSVPMLKPERIPLQERIEELRESLDQAVLKRLMSDVPLGTFLSGGLDSSLITAITRRHIENLHTFSVGIEGSNDLEAARLVSRHLGTVHHEYVITRDEVVRTLPQIIYHLESYDQDLVRSAVPCFFTSRLAAEHVKVILTGEGADELFAGYTYYKDIQEQAYLHRELRRSIASLHNVNLQRVDRMTMAHSIEGRVPFLDLKMIRLAQLIEPRWKLFGSPLVEKWILRAAFEDLLPKEILWREKEQFDEGSGAVDILEGIACEVMGREEAEVYRNRFPGALLRSPEECHYHRIFLDVFEKPEPILSNVARWAERPSFLQ